MAIGYAALESYGKNDLTSSDDNHRSGIPGLPGMPPAGRRSAPPGGAESDDEEDADLQDISKLQLTTPVNSSKFLRSPVAAMMRAEAVHAEHVKEKKAEERQVQAAREMASLAEWNKKMTTVAGVSMTNEDAQKARRRFIENEDHYADEAVRRGLIRNEDREGLKKSMRDKAEWQDREGRGIITNAERRAERAADASAIGRARDRATADLHQAIANEHTVDMRDTKAPEAATATRFSATGNAGSVAGAPSLNDAFTSKASPTFAVAQAPQAAPPSRKVEATGLDF